MNLASGTDCVKPRAIDLERRLGYLMLQVQVTLDTAAMFMAVLPLATLRSGSGPSLKETCQWLLTYESSAMVAPAQGLERG